MEHLHLSTYLPCVSVCAVYVVCLCACVVPVDMCACVWLRSERVCDVRVFVCAGCTVYAHMCLWCMVHVSM